MNHKEILKIKLTERIQNEPMLVRFFEKMFLKVLETKVEIENAKFNKENVPEDLLDTLVKSLMEDFEMMGFSEMKKET